MFTSAAESRAAFLERLHASGVLEPAQEEELSSQSSLRHLDAEALAQWLLKQGWLTPFQVEFLAGSGAPAEKTLTSRGSKK